MGKRELAKYGFEHDNSTGEMKAAISIQLLRYLDQNHIPYSLLTEIGGDAPRQCQNLKRKREQLKRSNVGSITNGTAVAYIHPRGHLGVPVAIR